MAQPQDDEGEDLTELSLEELMSIDVEVTSVSKQAKGLSESAAAIYVLTNEDIRRSGATSIAEALRMVPGINVAQINSSEWAISSRGFNDEFANKMLVLIDGRSVYNPLFSGVFWGIQDVVLEDVARIEVIRGPGAALWGANAVNGVINVIMKDASETQGNLVSVIAGDHERGTVTVRHGGTFGDEGTFRAHVKGLSRDGFQTLPSGIEDDWSFGNSGFRMDWPTDQGQSMTVQGNVYKGSSHVQATVPHPVIPFTNTFDRAYDWSGGNLLGRWSSVGEDGSSSTVQAYYDRTSFDSALIAEDRDTFDLDFQRTQQVGDAHSIIWGAGYRNSRSSTRGSATLMVNPSGRTDETLSTFIQDEIDLVPDEFKLTIGTKVEHNDYTQFEVQPNVRFAWTPDDEATIWGAASRAVRTPSQIDHDLQLLQFFIPGAPVPDTSVIIFGDEGFQAEELLAYELGYRIRSSDSLWIDVSTFYNDYDNLISREPGAPIPTGPTTVTVPVTVDNQLEGETYGLELAAQWNPAPDWMLHFSYTRLEFNLRAKPGSADVTTPTETDNNPKNQFHMRAYHNVSETLQLDGALYFVDSLSGNAASYTRVDLRAGWKANKDTSIELVVQGLGHDNEVEYPNDFFGGDTLYQSGAFIRATWSF